MMVSKIYKEAANEFKEGSLVEYSDSDMTYVVLVTSRHGAQGSFSGTIVYQSNDTEFTLTVGSHDCDFRKDSFKPFHGEIRMKQ